ncbi:hypothetical protein CVD28_22645 [Bacillus sp. M6-12]|uniref:hypothetical protein n=1 Tax=Bacillus sp. M6-12 TaxID=2054166 RepID=UPI000C75EB43|nr:hypothetical protein [Bacillus sp. M6-12]PLS15426.1 hypothetical protein CVD28_22645 [Bacillus sp. M6-12]
MAKDKLYLFAGILFYISSLSFLLSATLFDNSKVLGYVLFLVLFSLGTLFTILYTKKKTLSKKN